MSPESGCSAEQKNSQIVPGFLQESLTVSLLIRAHMQKVVELAAEGRRYHRNVRIIKLWRAVQILHVCIQPVFHDSDDGGVSLFDIGREPFFSDDFYGCSRTVHSIIVINRRHFVWMYRITPYPLWIVNGEGDFQWGLFWTC